MSDTITPEIDAAYQAFDAASWSCERMTDAAMMDLDWMREAIAEHPTTDGYPRAYRWTSGAHAIGGEVLHFTSVDLMGIAWNGPIAWGDADDVRNGVRQFLCNPRTWNV